MDVRHNRGRSERVPQLERRGVRVMHRDDARSPAHAPQWQHIPLHEALRTVTSHRFSGEPDAVRNDAAQRVLHALETRGRTLLRHVFWRRLRELATQDSADFIADAIAETLMAMFTTKVIFAGSVDEQAWCYIRTVLIRRASRCLLQSSDVPGCERTSSARSVDARCIRVGEEGPAQLPSLADAEQLIALVEGKFRESYKGWAVKSRILGLKLHLEAVAGASTEDQVERHTQFRRCNVSNREWRKATNRIKKLRSRARRDAQKAVHSLDRAGILSEHLACAAHVLQLTRDGAELSEAESAVTRKRSQSKKSCHHMSTR